MSDPYREATRNETGGKGTLPRAVLLAGGAFMAMLIAVGVWMAVGRAGPFEPSPEALTQLNFSRRRQGRRRRDPWACRRPAALDGCRGRAGVDSGGRGLHRHPG